MGCVNSVFPPWLLFATASWLSLSSFRLVVGSLLQWLKKDWVGFFPPWVMQGVAKVPFSVICWLGGLHPLEIRFAKTFCRSVFAKHAPQPALPDPFFTVWAGNQGGQFPDDDWFVGEVDYLVAVLAVGLVCCHIGVVPACC